MTPFTHVYFDFDSTLLAEESLDILADMRGVGADVRALTEASMSGHIPLERVFERKLNQIAPSRALIQAYIDAQPTFVEGAKELVTQLQEQNIIVGILTSNFHEIVDPLAAKIGITSSTICANHFRFHEDGSYAGFDPNAPLCQSGGKAQILISLRRENERWAFVGDSVSDMCCVGIADLTIGFGGVMTRPRVQTLADLFIQERSLLALLPVLLGS